MKKLKTLVDLLSPMRIKQIDILSSKLSNKTKLMQLYEGIRTGTFQDDKQAIIALYGPETPNTSYSKLKNDLECRLINLLIAADLTNNKMNSRQKAYFKYFKNWAAANILIRIGNIDDAIRILEKTLKHFQKHEFTFLALETAKLLRNHYFRHIGDFKKGTYYDELTNLYLQQYTADVKISGYLERIVAQRVKAKHYKADFTSTINSYFEKAKSILPSKLNGDLYYRFKMIELNKLMHVHDYQRTSALCEEVVDYFESNYKDYRTYIIITLNSWIICCIQLKDYQQAIRLSEKAEDYLKVGEFNWFKFMEYRTQLAFYQEDYTMAYETYIKVIKHPKLATMPKHIQEEWKLYEAYCQFIRLAGYVKGRPANVNKFRVQRFLNELYVFNHDKKGLNITITMIHLCFQIMYGQWNLIIDKMEALEKYRQRHLSSKKHERSNIFTKMLMTLVKNNFDSQKMNLNIEHLKQSLAQIPLDELNTIHEVEIIPYEKLWDILVGILDKRTS